MSSEAMSLPALTEPNESITELTESSTTNSYDMNKKKLIKTAAFKSLMPYKTEQKAVDAFLCAISDALKEDREVNIPDFGRFYVQNCPESRYPFALQIPCKSMIYKGFSFSGC